MNDVRQRVNARSLALEALCIWEKGDSFARDIIEDLAARHRLEPRDTALLQTLVLTTLRNLTLLNYFAARLCDWDRVEGKFRWIVRLGLVQLLIIGVPAHAAVNETVAIAERARTLVNAVLRRAQREFDELLRDTAAQPLPVRFSHPAWLVERWEKQIGAPTAKLLCEWNQQPAPVFIRINQLHPQAPDAAATDGMLPAPGPHFFQTDQPPRDWLADGKCYVQDPSTALACELLARSGEFVLDACAAPGGKTALLAQMMENKGRLIACDNAPRRIPRLQENLRRLRVACARIYEHDWLTARNTPWGAQRFDRILLDAPCSNTGVMRRRVDVRWRLQPSAFAEMASLQTQLLAATFALLKPGGALVYSTCSLDAEENEQIIEAFLRQHPEARCTAMKHSLPWRDAMDGAFAARIEITTA